MAIDDETKEMLLDACLAGAIAFTGYILKTMTDKHKIEEKSKKSLIKRLPTKVNKFKKKDN